MLKKSLFIAAAVAMTASGLTAPAALAAPFGDVNAGGESQRAAPHEKRSALSIVIDHMQFSFAAIRRASAESGSESTEYKSRNNEQCDQDEISDEDEEHGETTRKAEPVGPEPIYFGF